MFLLFSLLTYDDNGNTYSSKEKKILEKVKKSTEYFTVESSVEEIKAGSTGNSAFSLCSGTIKNVIFAKDSKCKTLGSFLFSETSIQSVDFSSCYLLEIIPVSCFQKCSFLNNILLPPNVTNIQSRAFYYCTELSKISFPDSLTYIEDTTNDKAFGSCSKLTEIEISENSNLTYIGTLAFFQAGLKKFSKKCRRNCLLTIRILSN